MQPVSQHFGSTPDIHVVFQTQTFHLLIAELVGQECQDALRAFFAFLFAVMLRLLDGIAEEEPPQNESVSSVKSTRA